MCQFLELTRQFVNRATSPGRLFVDPIGVRSRAMRRTLRLSVLVAALVAACGSPTGGDAADASPDAIASDGAADTTTSDAPRADGGDVVRPSDVTGDSTGGDTGPADPCAADEASAITTVGCNGYASGEPAANTPAGVCTGSAEPMGSCMAGSDCSGDPGMMGRCYPTCTVGAMYVTRGTCPMGFRCFDIMGAGVCYRDCDTAHACPMGMTCDGDGSCVE